MEDLLKVGVITTTHGVRGEVKVYPTTDEPERFLELDYVLLDTGRELRKLEIKNVKAVISGSHGKRDRSWKRMNIILRIFWECQLSWRTDRNSAH